MDRLLKSTEVQELLSISKSALLRLRREGLPYIKVGYNCIRYRESDVWKWIESRDDALRIDKSDFDA